MKHQTLDQLQVVAEVKPQLPHVLSRSERLERWAQLLERSPNRRLSTLHQTEYQPINARDVMRTEGSPLSVAFEDSVLRDAGLKGDSYGEAKRFFELTDGELHDVICYCHFGASVNAAMVASRVRGVMAGRKPGFFARLREAFIG
jgi:hypothetical protein